MADNIKIVGNILNIQQVPRYDDADISLLAAQTIQEDFGLTNDYIEYFVYDGAGNILNTTYTYRDFKSPTTSYVNPKNNGLPIIEIDPVKDLQNIGYSSGEFKVQYNLFTNKISNSDAELFLKEISADRTELRVGSTILTNEQIESGSLELINEYTNSPYFVDYLLNFGDNTQVVVVNVALNKVESGYEILFKLYQPLPDSIQEKNTLWVVQEKSNPYSFDINLDKLIIQDPGPKLRGPNFNIDIPNQNNVATSYQTYTSLVNSVQNVSTSSYQQLLSLITSQSIDINVDYTDFTNFSFFGSAKQRVINFYDKVKQIEDYNNLIASYTPNVSTTSNLSLEITSSKNAINTIIAQFDGYEQYLYFESSSYTWPKTNTTIPYILATTASAQTWYNALTGSAEIYDDDNQNNLVFTLPSFIKDDEDNDPYITFLNMVGHYFDNIWIFLQAVTDINLANNNLEKGVSKDLVYYVLQSLGVKLYNQYGDSDNVSFLVGASGSSNWDNNFTYTGSYLNAIPRKDLLAESYKRIYHNLPLLLKTKGTAYGLETLISTFGISNKDHYTILDANNSASYWYTPTGSAITSSILKVKEYGGDIKSGLLDEFNNDKIRIVSNTITGSVLSPYISLQQQPTSSTQFRTNDLHYVDISFSPQDKIDIFTSASVVANNPTWSLDDFIGDPRFQYNQNYPTLETERTTYLSPLSASVVSYTGSSASGSIGATDYNSFIRLIQFFDNSLFKMLKDYVPARTNLSTGVTISSPILERNKWVFANPSSTSEIEVEDGTISGPSIQTEYTDLYEGINYDNKAAYYDGNLTGSGVNVHNYFVSGNINPYLSNIAVWNAQYPQLESIDLNKFAHSDYNVMLNNVSKSLISRIREDIQFIPGTTQSILSPAELQDSYESLKAHQLSRYEGVKLSSAEYNNYTVGDISFGKTATIDKNVSKLGLFSEITPNKFLPNRNNTILKYLVDIDGNLTELNLRNTHWEEIQNTFIAGDTGSVSQFNNQLYSNQKTTDGEKLIYDSGYSYSPLLYFPSCSIAGSNNISFQNQKSTSAYLATAQNLSSSYFVSGSSPLGFPVSGGVGGAIINIFNYSIDTPSTYFLTGSLTAPPAYTASETGQYKVNASMDMTITMAPGNHATWSLEMYKNGTLEASSSQQVYFGNITGSCTSWLLTTSNMSDPIVYTVNYTSCADGTPASTRLTSGLVGGVSVCSRTEPYIFDSNTGNPAFPGAINKSTFTPCDNYVISGSTTQNISFNIDRGNSNSNYVSLESTPADKLTFQLKLRGISNSNYTASLSTGNLSVGSLALSTGYSSINCPFISGSTSDSITFTTTLSSFYNRGYIFTPNPASGSRSSLYGDYGDVDYTFDPKENDMVILYLSDNSILEYTISRVSVDSSTNKLSLYLNADLSTTARNDLNSGTYKRFLLLSRQKDETNVILNFIKRDGKSSNGFLIPENISQTVLNNIDIITKEVKQKILGDQPIINDIQGGTFGP